MKQSMHTEKMNIKRVSLMGWVFAALIALTAQPSLAQALGDMPVPQSLPDLPPAMDVVPGMTDAGGQSLPGQTIPGLAAPQNAAPVQQSGMMQTGFGGHPGIWQPGQQSHGEQPQAAQSGMPAQFMPGGSHHNKFPKFHPNFWKGHTGAPHGHGAVPGQGAPQATGTNFISGGTVLSAILDHDLSSRTCKNGDVFSLTLQDGFVVNGRMAIAPHSKILGTVVNCVPAKMQRHGHAGSLEVSLQTLVLPDGSHMPFYGFIEHNPNHLFEKPHKKRWAGVDVRDYGQSVAGMFSSLLTGPGWIHARRQRGNEFLLGEGEVLPVRVTRGLNVPEVQVASAPAPNAVPAGLPPTASVSTASTLSTMPANGGVPGLADSNEIFNTPLQPSPANQLPDPF